MARGEVLELLAHHRLLAVEGARGSACLRARRAGCPRSRSLRARSSSARAPGFSARLEAEELAGVAPRSARGARRGRRARGAGSASPQPCLVAALVEVVEDRALARLHLLAYLRGASSAQGSGVAAPRERAPRPRGFPRAMRPSVRSSPPSGSRRTRRCLVEADQLRLEPSGRAEVDDLDGPPPGHAVEAADALLHLGRVARQVEEHETPAELEVAPLAAALGGDEQGGALGAAELRHLEVAAVRGQVLVEDGHAAAGGRLEPCLERRAGSCGRGRRRGPCLSSGAAAGPTRASRPRREPDDARVARVLVVVARQARLRGAAPRGPPAAGTRGGMPPMSTRRVALVQGGRGRPASSAAMNVVLRARRPRGAAARGAGRSRARRPRGASPRAAARGGRAAARGATAR